MSDAPSTETQAKGVLAAMTNASETVRGAIASSIPVASNQVLTVSLPGTVIDWKDYYYNVSKHIKPPLDVQIKEARLVDGMIPLSKYTAGKTGKSVARSYLAALDLLVPVEASVSGVVSNETGDITDPRLKTIRERYKYSMGYLTSPDDTPSGNGRTKVETYVMKQSAWAKEVAEYQRAQAEALRTLAPPAGATTAQVKASQEKYMQWIQEHAREFKNTIQTKYMDWVVHGYKFMVDFHFGIVDISSGMKRIENSKEAYRNLTVIASDGSSEYNGVVLTPISWATMVAKKTLNWKKDHAKPNPAELRAEIRRLQGLLVSHETLAEAIEKNAFFPVLSSDSPADNKKVKEAYAQVYSDMDTKNAESRGQDKNESNKTNWLKESFGADLRTENVLKDLTEEQKKHDEASLNRNNRSVRDNADQNKEKAKSWIGARVKQINQDIDDLKKQLSAAEAAPLISAPPMLPVVNAEGIVVTGDELVANPSLKNPGLGNVIDLDNEDTWRNAADDGPDSWTKISCKVSSKSSYSETSTSQSASSICGKAGWGWWSASASASHTESSAEAMSSMSNLDVEVSMSCMVVEIERPWLHAELFADAELDSGAFKISPGEDVLRDAFNNGKNLTGEYQQFSSYPTAFVIAADIELSFSGDTTKLESAVSASSTQANVSVGWGPFAVSGSHSSSKSKSKTKMESTATGCRISVEAPQIVGWVQTLLPMLPKPKNGVSTMSSPFSTA
ncbi:hypothetical protein FMUND_6511 [Fusarium mundagurra]|uniref:Uncharacterized protein n=1 Tax=Fusarium mundagurra TaxID=1567541 RepID=A0A8H5YP21_9HYPO|nr:hypothetical protein FMUND_6511 [Fusarium mundagurra]